jgi:hypothetical protein
MEDEKPLTETESLALIQSMIHKAQGSVRDNGFYFLLWGWLVFVAAMSQYIMVKFIPALSDYNGLPWAILMPLGGIVSGVRGSRQRKKEKVKTYAGEMLKYVSIAFGVALFIVLFFGSINLGWESAYPMVMMVYGMWLFISGGVLKFTPLIIGGIIDWCCSIGAFYIPHSHSIELIPLLAFAVLAGYIIPGHLLSAKYRKAMTMSQTRNQ